MAIDDPAHLERSLAPSEPPTENGRSNMHRRHQALTSCRRAASARRIVSRLLVLALLVGAGGAIGGEVRFDLERLDGDGLYGPPDARRALDYEFCIPDHPATSSEVAAIDPSARFFPGSPGRIGCGTGELLVLGNSHQPGFRQILEALASLPYTGPIIEAHFE